MRGYAAEFYILMPEIESMYQNGFVDKNEVDHACATSTRAITTSCRGADKLQTTPQGDNILFTFDYWQRADRDLHGRLHRTRRRMPTWIQKLLGRAQLLSRRATNAVSAFTRRPTNLVAGLSLGAPIGMVLKFVPTTPNGTAGTD